MISANWSGSFWLPVDASTVADSVDADWWLVFWISIALLAGVTAVQLTFMIKYRRRPGHKAQITPTHHYPLEITWSILPALILVVMFIEGVDGFLDMRMPPADTYDIEVVGHQWAWSFIYPNGSISPELHVPVDTDVKLVMSSTDVIHSLFIPAFRVKQDVVPGRYNYLWFNATDVSKEGHPYPLYCAEYCGKDHSIMRADVYVHTEEGMAAWFEEQHQKILDMPPIELGEMLYEKRQCAQCHSTGTERIVGPGFATTFGTAHKFADGSSITAAEANENFIRESIVNPQLHVRAGFPPTMPTFKGMFGPGELRGLVAFIKSRNPEYAAETQKQFAKSYGEIQAEKAAKEKGEATEGEQAGDAETAQESPEPTPAPALEGSVPGGEGGEPTDVRD